MKIEQLPSLTVHLRLHLIPPVVYDTIIKIILFYCCALLMLQHEIPEILVSMSSHEFTTMF